jgi:hypothetical protein
VDSGGLIEARAKVTIRSATPGDILAFRGAPHGKTIRGIAAVRETPAGTETLGLAGVCYGGDVAFMSQLVAFVHLADSFAEDPEIMGAVVTAALRMRRLLRSIDAPIFAVRDTDEARSEKFLKVMGFALVDWTETEGEIWQYRRTES